jgi:sulfite reductase (NADPH) flavoprotein alpha-component
MALAELLPLGTDRLLTAAAVAVGYVGLCGGTVLGHLRRRAPAAATAGVDAVTVAYASQTGLGEQIARHTQAALVAGGHAARLVPVSALDRATLEAGGRILLVLATTGEGDAPDAAAGFARRVLGEDADLARLRYGLLALGDRSYRQFCAFGLGVGEWLDRHGAQPLFPPVTVGDSDPAAGALAGRAGRGRPRRRRRREAGLDRRAPFTTGGWSSVASSIPPTPSTRPSISPSSRSTAPATGGPATSPGSASR